MKPFLHLPSKNNSYYESDKRFNLDSRLIFTFGSNEAGRHGAGAALFARLAYGAKYGVGSGRTGRCYAIPTKDKNLKVLPLESIHRYVNEFIQFTQDHTELYFYVTPIGTGYAGFEHSEIAPLFKGCINSWFPLEWKPYLEGDTSCLLPIVP